MVGYLFHVSQERQAISHNLHNNGAVARLEDRDVGVVLVG